MLLNVQTSTPLPTPKELKISLPLTDEQHHFVLTARQSVCNILSGSDDRLLLIVGPCSIHDIKSAIDYAERLKALSKQVEDRIFLVMRTFFEKPRTIFGWKGLIHDPHLDGSSDVPRGLFLARRLLKTLAAMRLPAGMEFLEPITPYYLSDLITWGCIGARTATSQPHRQLASALLMPVGFKNSVDGNIASAVHGITAAAQPQSLLGIDNDALATLYQTQGNAHGHLILRGGGGKPNYDSAASAACLLSDAGRHPRLIIDCAHGNSHPSQAAVFERLTAQPNSHLCGLMLESNIHSGNQSLSNNHYGVSLTDPCLDWETTERLILQAYSTIACCAGCHAGAAGSTTVSSPSQ